LRNKPVADVRAAHPVPVTAKIRIFLTPLDAKVNYICFSLMKKAFGNAYFCTGGSALAARPGSALVRFLHDGYGLILASQGQD